MKPLILAVDDDIRSRKLACDFLAVSGYRVAEAGDGEECLCAVTRERPDLILLDMQMPRMDGVETMKRLKGNPLTSAIPVVILSASAMDSEKKKMRDAGFNIVLSKPVNLRELMATVKACLNGASGRNNKM